MPRTWSCALLLVALVVLSACDENNGPMAPSPPPTAVIADDAALLRHVTQVEPFGGYSLFPNADAVTTGTLIGSDAHRPMIRVRLNDTARSVLQDGQLPIDTRFPDGSVVFKEILGSQGTVSAYAIMYKAAGDPRAGNGWLWAEFTVDGGVMYSIANRSAACTGCHLLNQGPRNDLVRTFERQR